MTPSTAIWIKNLNLFGNRLRLLRHDSAFKVAFILLFATGMMVGFFLMFYDGFRFLSTMGGGFMITRPLLDLFFLGLGLMLVMSGIITSYSSLFRSRETVFLLTAPLDTRTLVTCKFLESTGLSSWAFLLLMIPFTAAYALHNRLGIPFAFWTLVFSIPLVLLCGALGTLVALLAVRWLPRRRLFWLLAAGGLLLLLLRGVLAMKPLLQEEATFVFNRLLPGLQLAAHPLMPNHWATEGIMALTYGEWTRGAWMGLTLATTAAVVILLVQAVGEWCFYPACQQVAGGKGARRSPAERLAWLDRMLILLPHDIRGMVLKDLRIFLRDPLQWSQALIFFGLLALYFSSFRSFHYNETPPVWRNLIVFLNLFSVSSVICSLASRFVYPQLSLEGHSFWILGLAPTGMRRILLTKFALASLAMVSISVTLMGLAAWMLQVDGRLGLLSLALTTAIALAVSALSTGLGALFLDLRQSNPVAILSGFGGTMNLVLSLGFMAGMILPFGLVWHWHASESINATLFFTANVAAVIWGLMLTTLAVALPLWLGIRSLRNREY